MQRSGTSQIISTCTNMPWETHCDRQAVQSQTFTTASSPGARQGANVQPVPDLAANQPSLLKHSIYDIMAQTNGKIFIYAIN